MCLNDTGHQPIIAAFHYCDGDQSGTRRENLNANGSDSKREAVGSRVETRMQMDNTAHLLVVFKQEHTKR